MNGSLNQYFSSVQSRGLPFRERMSSISNVSQTYTKSSSSSNSADVEPADTFFDRSLLEKIDHFRLAGRRASGDNDDRKMCQFSTMTSGFSNDKLLYFAPGTEIVWE